jgi:hypothetical protein
MPQKSKTVLVTGDVIVDHQIYMGERSVPNDSKKTGMQELKKPRVLLAEFEGNLLCQEESYLY